LPLCPQRRGRGGGRGRRRARSGRGGRRGQEPFEAEVERAHRVVDLLGLQLGELRRRVEDERVAAELLGRRRRRRAGEGRRVEPLRRRRRRGRLRRVEGEGVHLQRVLDGRGLGLRGRGRVEGEG